ncbi:hypothetical protein KCU77_g107, partial [Aureobasidium melanogenum]
LGPDAKRRTEQRPKRSVHSPNTSIAGLGLVVGSCTTAADQPVRMSIRSLGFAKMDTYKRLITALVSDKPRGLLAFAEDGYVWEGPGLIIWRNPPAKLEEELKTSKKMYCVSVGPNGGFFSSWKDNKGKTMKCMCRHIEGSLSNRTRCLSELTRLYHRLRTIHGFRLFIGSYYINNLPIGQGYEGVHRKLGIEIRRRYSEREAYVQDPVHVTLGVEKTYALVVKWELRILCFHLLTAAIGLSYSRIEQFR